MVDKKYDKLEDWEWDAVIQKAKQKCWCVIGEKIAILDNRGMTLITGNVTKIEKISKVTINNH